MVYHIWHRKPGTEVWRHRVVRTQSRAWATAVAMARYPGEEVQIKKGSVD